MTASQPTNSQDLSACHQASVELSGGIGDFSDSDRVMTRHYVCTTCKEACDLYMSEQPGPLDELYNPSISDLKLDEHHGDDKPVIYIDEAKAALRTYIAGEVAKAIQIHDIEQRIEWLDVQCSEGSCKNCDSKRPLLKELRADLERLSFKKEKDI